MIIAKNKSKITKKTLSYFQNIELLKKSWPIFLASLILILLAFRVKDDVIELQSIICLVAGILASPLYFLFAKIAIEKNNKNFKEGAVNYVFKSDCIEVFEEVEGGKSSILSFNEIFKLSQTKKQIFLYLNKNMALVVNKDGFFEGSLEKVLALLDLKVVSNKQKKEKKK